MRPAVGLLALVLAACTPAALQAVENALQSGQAAVVPAEALACAVASDLDPSGATALCAYVDATGNVVSAVFQVAETVADIAALCQHTKAPSAQALVVLHAEERQRVAARKAAAAPPAPTVTPAPLPTVHP